MFDNQVFVECNPIPTVGEPEIIKFGQSSHNMYSNNIVNFQDSTTILNTCTKKKSGKLLNSPHITFSVPASKLIQYLKKNLLI